MTRILVGSTNPVKVAATERVVAGVLDATVEGVTVDSGVSEQPRRRAETVAGAENRARRALAAGDADYGVGVEGGVAETDGPPGTWLVMWAAVTDGDRLARGGGPSIRLPDDVAQRVRDGGELGPVLDDQAGTSDVGEGVGAAGVLTGGAVDRESSLVHAVAGAFGPFVTDHYEG
ncbi:inosine/xanthosine triphosphatase [Halomicrobium urmianum]|uniref:inosine/xanthosine triphosphatase n=1 Tax=Halomicrobium urmianum TaxID=1586233 RepID=UPI001CD9CA8B|nr:inosine/xanthosine triphosphatase [Halomicrobium urmianum]